MMVFEVDNTTEQLIGKLQESIQTTIDSLEAGQREIKELIDEVKLSCFGLATADQADSISEDMTKASKTIQKLATADQVDIVQSKIIDLIERESKNVAEVQSSLPKISNAIELSSQSICETHGDDMARLQQFFTQQSISDAKDRMEQLQSLSDRFDAVSQGLSRQIDKLASENSMESGHHEIKKLIDEVKLSCYGLATADQAMAASEELSKALAAIRKLATADQVDTVQSKILGLIEQESKNVAEVQSSLPKISNAIEQSSRFICEAQGENMTRIQQFFTEQSTSDAKDRMEQLQSLYGRFETVSQELSRQIDKLASENSMESGHLEIKKLIDEVKLSCSGLATADQAIAASEELSKALAAIQKLSTADQVDVVQSKILELIEQESKNVAEVHSSLPKISNALEQSSRSICEAQGENVTRIQSFFAELSASDAKTRIEQLQALSSKFDVVSQELSAQMDKLASEAETVLSVAKDNKMVLNSIANYLSLPGYKRLFKGMEMDRDEIDQ